MLVVKSERYLLSLWNDLYPMKLRVEIYVLSLYFKVNLYAFIKANCIFQAR